MPFPPSLPHILACRGLPGIAPHVLSFHAVGHRGTISHRTVTSHAGGVFYKATTDYVFLFALRAHSIK